MRMVNGQQFVTVFLVFLLINAFTSEAMNSCPGCSIYPYKDSPYNDIGLKLNTLPVECADWCFSSQDCIGFVVSPQRDCWIKSQVSAMENFTVNDQRVIVLTYRNDCKGLFSS